MSAPKASKLLKESEIERLDAIKRTALTGMFADDELMDVFVLKGGSALDLVHRVSARASIDIDLSMPDDLPYPMEEACERIAANLSRAFEATGLSVFDVTMEAVPAGMTADLADFWGGYQLYFKLIEKSKFTTLSGDIEAMRRSALMLGQRGKFRVDISKFEYCATKAVSDIDGYRIYVYTPEMIVAEKLRSLCQQSPEYSESVRNHQAQRSRDLVDIHAVITHFKLEMNSEENLELIRAIFDAKRVPLKLIGSLEEQREYHRSDFPSVINSIKTGVQLQPYDFYFDALIELTNMLKALWNE